MGAVAAVRERVRAGGLLRAGGPVLVMLSGGRDSTCLLDLAVALCGAGEVGALHVNYGLREASGGDERHCAALCERLGVELEVVRARERDPLGAASDEEGNLQAWARDLRYEAARRLARARGGVFATGHTSSDQVETVLYRLASSPGRRALLGMVSSEEPLIRPLLEVTREQTAAYCRERGLSWREDESNADERFARTRVRHGLLEALRTVHPAAESNVLRTAALLREETRLLDGLVEAELCGRNSIEIERLAAMAPALARLVVVALAERAAGGYVPQAGDRVAEIIALSEHRGRAELHVGGLAAAVVERGVLEMVRLPPRASGR